MTLEGTQRDLALRRHWGEFPVCPSDVEADVARRLFPAECLDPRGTLGTPAFRTESVARWLELTRATDCLDVAQRLAIHRAMLTVIAELDDQYPRHQYTGFAPGGLLEVAINEYHSLPWLDAGIELETYVRDAVELVIWRGLHNRIGVRHLFLAIPRQQGDRVDAVLAKMHAELRSGRYRNQEAGLLSAWATFVVLHDRRDDFVRVARMLGSDTCILSVQMLAEVALGRFDDDELALAVFAAANQPGEGQAFLIDECRRQLGQGPPPDVTVARGASAGRQLRKKKLGRRYALVSVEAAGPLSTVWKARDDRDGQTVAIKVPVPSKHAEEPDPTLDAFARLRHESHILARLHHPAIVRRLTSAGLRAQSPYLVMEHINGRTLASYDRLTPVEAVRILLPIVDALGFAHSRGIIHRDIKPGNVLCARGPDGQVIPKLIDFGLSTSRLPTNVPDSPGRVYGTLDYMSPEQLAGRTLDARSDVWSLCVTLYEVVLGRLAFPGVTDESSMVAAQSVEPPALDLLGVADSEFASIVSKGMKRSKTERWADMDELGTALAGWLVGAGVDVDSYGVPVADWLSSRPLARRSEVARVSG